jgi:predicted peptidase
MKTSIALFWFVLLTGIASTQAEDRGLATAEEMKQLASAFEARVYRNGEDSMVYRLLKPLDYDPAKSYPVVLYLHGGGDGGKNNWNQLRFCLIEFLKEENRRKYPCFVVAPQLFMEKPDETWGWAGVKHWDRPYRTPVEPSFGERCAMAIVDSVQKEFNTDPARFYIMGYSMGALGVWDLACRFPDRVAAIVPICGGGEPDKVEALKNVAVWAFHGEADKTIFVQRSREMIEAMKGLGLNPTYTEYAGEGHDIWSRAFAEPELFPWLFGQKKTLAP